MITNYQEEKDKKIYKLYKENTQTQFKVYYGFFAFFIACQIMALVSSAQLKNDYQYLQDLQVSIIVCVAISISLQLLSVYLLRTKSLTHYQFLIMYLLMLPSSIFPILQLVSFLQGSFDKYCGFLIRHEGKASPWLIIFQLKMYFPSCSEMENNGNLQYQLRYNSVKAIIKECSTYYAKDSCYQFDTLKVDDWDDMFLVQIVSFVSSVIWVFCVTILLILLKAKHFQITQRCNQEIQSSFLTQSATSQVIQYQPSNYQTYQSNPQMYSQNMYGSNNQNLHSNQPVYMPAPLSTSNQEGRQQQYQDIVVGQPINS